MAAHPKEIQDKKMAYYMPFIEDLMPKIGSPKQKFFYDKISVINLVNILDKEEAATVELLSGIDEFQVWRMQAIKFLWGFFQDPKIFDVEKQRELQPLVDLFYYFNTEPTVSMYLRNFEAIKSITQAQSNKFPSCFKTYAEQLTQRIFHESGQTVAAVIKQLFEAYTGIDEGKPISGIAQAYVAAQFIIYLKFHDDLVLLTKERREAFDKAINDFSKNYFFLKKSGENYYDPTYGENKSLKDLFRECNSKVEERVALVTNPIKCIPFLPSSCIEGNNKSMFLLMLQSHAKKNILDLKSLFLELFPIYQNGHNAISFFKKEDPISSLLKQEKIDWNEILCKLPKPDETNTVEYEKIEFFAEVVGLVNAQKSMQAEYSNGSSSMSYSAAKL